MSDGTLSDFFPGVDRLALAVLKDKLSLRSDAELIELALNLLDWAADEASAGRYIASVDAQKKRFSAIEFEKIEALRRRIAEQFSLPTLEASAAS